METADAKKDGSRELPFGGLSENPPASAIVYCYLIFKELLSSTPRPRPR
jgi:hypothetical protein